MRDVRLREGCSEEVAQLGLEPGKGTARTKALRLEEA